MQIEDLKVGDVLPGVLANTVDAGRFVELDEGLEGLVLYSTIHAGGWNRADELGKLGEGIRVRVLRVDVKQRRIRLCPADPSPNGIHSEESFLDWLRSKEGQVVPGRLVNDASIGRFVDLGYGVDGLLHKAVLAEQDVTGASLGRSGARIQVVVIGASDRKHVRLRLPEPSEREPQPARAPDGPREVCVEFVVDASNVARSDPERGYSAVQDLLELLAVKFPGCRAMVVADASLVPFLRNDFGDEGGADRLSDDIRLGEVCEAPGGSDADVPILREARKRNAIVVTRDRYIKHPQLRTGVRLLDWEYGEEGLRLEHNVTVHDSKKRWLVIPLLPEPK